MKTFPLTFGFLLLFVFFFFHHQIVPCDQFETRSCQTLALTLDQFDPGRGGDFIPRSISDLALLTSGTGEDTDKTLPERAAGYTDI